MQKLHRIHTFHDHQPAGNFDHILGDCYATSYLPFLETLPGHPKLKVVLHNVAACTVDYGEETT